MGLNQAIGQVQCIRCIRCIRCIQCIWGRYKLWGCRHYGREQHQHQLQARPPSCQWSGRRGCTHQRCKESRWGRSVQSIQCIQCIRGRYKLWGCRHYGREQRFQCSECDPSSPTNVKFLTLAGARKHYHMCHSNRSLICWICKDSHSSEDQLHAHLTSRHADLVGVQDDEVHGIVSCLHCSLVFGSHIERVKHTRFMHLVESIDITTTDLEEVTMVGGHVIEFSLGSERIVALHTIP